ncbi:alpha-glucosidase [Nakamurella endophytica]|uniref:Glucohydrolase n=1 Tax=Nakamurella endophytica TaxID=1748367 RepID=A0A917SQE3_9ACTN|nr:alpha-glucosidase [Nakamurella endophytica]GGL91702.1 glucohydrolase [Nakamurella endophytica]
MSTDLAPEIADVATAQWWRSAVVYQIYPRSFADGNGDGIGDLAGIRQHVDHLVDLGVDVVWLSPVYPSPGDDNGYDISDYRGIDPVFGTLEDFDGLLEDLHARGIKLVMDLVVNHTSDEHPWFVDSRSGRDKRDWYIWRPPRPGRVGGEPGAEPNNWSSFFSGPAWQYDAASGEYYLHLFSARQPDLNWENADVRRAVYNVMNWWLDRGIDGFRMDVINLISKRSELPDGPVASGRQLGDGFPHYGDGPRIHEFLAEMRREVFAGRPGAFLTVGETPGTTVDVARHYTDPARAELDMVFHFEHVGVDHGPSGKFEPAPLAVPVLLDVFERWQTGLAGAGWNSLYWNNHDQPRVVSRFGDDGRFWRESATALATALHLQRGTPYIFQGEEIGMTNMPWASTDELRDIESLRYHAEAVGSGLDPAEALTRIRRMGRDNARTPMQWSSGRNAGFSSGTPWIAVNPNAERINAEAQRRQRDSIFAYYRELVRLRHDLPVVAHGNFVRRRSPAADVFAFSRRFDGTELAVAVNLSGRAVPIAPLTGVPVLANYDGAGDPATLRPWEARAVLQH